MVALIFPLISRSASEAKILKRTKKYIIIIIIMGMKKRKRERERDFQLSIENISEAAEREVWQKEIIEA